jgi:hypothetical protein
MNAGYSPQDVGSAHELNQVANRGNERRPSWLVGATSRSSSAQARSDTSR